MKTNNSAYPGNPQILRILVQTIFTATLALAIAFTLSCSSDGGGGGGSGLSSSDDGADVSSSSGGSSGSSSSSDGNALKMSCIRETLEISAYTLNDIAAECGATKGEVLSQLPSTFGTCKAKDLEFDKPIKKIKEECGVDEIPTVSSSSSSKGNTGGSSSSSGGGSSSSNKSSASTASSSSQKWYAYTYKDAVLDNEITGEDDDGKAVYKIINASGNAELKIKSINQASWNDYAAATLALSKDKNLDLSKCSGFSYRYRGPGHRFTLESSDDYKPIVFYNWNDASIGWTTATFTVASFTRDTYDSNSYSGSIRDMINDKIVANFSWIVRAPTTSSGAWSISGTTLEIADFKCIESGGNGTFTGDYGTFTDDRDGISYEWVKIGGKYWMAENLNYDYGEYYEYETFCNTYGRLYEGWIANDVCPDGWHLPSDAEWDAGKSVLLDYPQYGGNCNSSGNCKDLGSVGYWWSATDYTNSSQQAYGRRIYPNDASVGRIYAGKLNLYSVRCVKD
jgi:hypothetical protein